CSGWMGQRHRIHVWRSERRAVACAVWRAAALRVRLSHCYGGDRPGADGSPMTMSYPLEAIGVLVLGAVVALLLVGPTSTRPVAAMLVGLPFYILAFVLGWLAGPPLGLASAGLCAIGLIAPLLLPVLEAQVPAQVAEAAALL